MARIRVGGHSGEFRKWSDLVEGTVLEGTFLGLHEGKFGPLLDLESNEGRLTLSVPTVLHRQLDKIRVGAAIVIDYVGKPHNEATGRDYHDFATFVEDAQDLRPPAAHRPGEPADIAEHGAAS
jgi:hypothetical protein